MHTELKLVTSLIVAVKESVRKSHIFSNLGSDLKCVTGFLEYLIAFYVMTLCMQSICCIKKICLNVSINNCGIYSNGHINNLRLKQTSVKISIAFMCKRTSNLSIYFVLNLKS